MRRRAAQVHAGVNRVEDLVAVGIEDFKGEQFGFGAVLAPKAAVRAVLIAPGCGRPTDSSDRRWEQSVQASFDQLNIPSGPVFGVHFTCQPISALFLSMRAVCSLPHSQSGFTKR